MKRILRFPLQSLVAVALLVTLAIPAAPALGQTTSAANTGQIIIDVPAASASVNNGSRVLIGGWAVDPAGPGNGIDQVRVYLDGMMDQGGTLLGSATTGGPRPDVARALNNQAFTDSGFDFFWMPTNVNAGNHTIYVYAHSTASSSWSYKSVVVTVAGQSTGADQYMPGSGMGENRYGQRGMGHRGMMGQEGMQYPYDLMDRSRGRGRSCVVIYFPPPPDCERVYILPPPQPPPFFPQPIVPQPIVPQPGPISVTPASVTGTTVTLIWAPVSGAVTYLVLQRTPTGAFVPANVSNITPVSATVTGLIPLTTYIFQVVAVDATGIQGTPSTPVTITTTLGP